MNRLFKKSTNFRPLQISRQIFPPKTFTPHHQKFVFSLQTQTYSKWSFFKKTISTPFVRVYDWSKSIFAEDKSEERAPDQDRTELAPFLEKLQSSEVIEFVKKFDPNFSSSKIQDFARESILTISASLARGSFNDCSHLFYDNREIERLRDIYMTKTPPNRREMLRITQGDFYRAKFYFHKHAFLDRQNNVVYIIAMAEGKHSRYRIWQKKPFKLAYTIAKTLDEKTPLKVRDVQHATRFYSRLL